MIYLSLLELDPSCRRVQAEMRNPYELHRTLSKAFGDEAGVFAAARCLFRVEAVQSVRVLVQSLVAPQWEALTVDANYHAAQPRIKAMDPAFRAGQTLRFRLRANPTKRVGADKEQDELAGKRVQIFGEDQQLAWLARRAESSGFGLQDCRISAVERQISHKGGGAQVVHQAVTFDGLLRVTDPEAFRQAVEQGIGSAKGFGFGLLSIAPG